MNKNQVKGATTSMLGKAQRAAGKVVGSRRLQTRGVANQIAGKVQGRVGDAEHALAAPATRKTSRRTTTRTRVTRVRTR
ncbi:MAG TPA: CsbD family protein [Planctomycetota bacterium]